MQSNWLHWLHCLMKCMQCLKYVFLFRRPFNDTAGATIPLRSVVFRLTRQETKDSWPPRTNAPLRGFLLCFKPFSCQRPARPLQGVLSALSESESERFISFLWIAEYPRPPSSGMPPPMVWTQGEWPFTTSCLFLNGKTSKGKKQPAIFCRCGVNDE